MIFCLSLPFNIKTAAPCSPQLLGRLGDFFPLLLLLLQHLLQQQQGQLLQQQQLLLPL